jgi:hypothetical protein
MTVRDLRSWVEDVTDAEILDLESSSRMTRFFESCSWIRQTCTGYETEPLDESTGILHKHFSVYRKHKHCQNKCQSKHRTFSTPFTMKYPPGSKMHSFARSNCGSDMPARMHLHERNMIGMRPI